MDALQIAIKALDARPHPEVEREYLYDDAGTRTTYSVTEESLVKLGARLLDGESLQACWSDWCASADQDEYQPDASTDGSLIA